MNRLVVCALAILMLVTPLAVGHAADVSPRPGTVLAAPSIQAAASEESLFESHARELAVAVPGGLALAAHDGVTLAVDVFAQEPGWYLVALDEADERSTHVMATAAVVRMHEAVAMATGPAVAGPQVRAGTLAVFAPADAGASHAHGSGPSAAGREASAAYAGARNAWIQWDAGSVVDGGGARGKVVGAHGDASILRFTFPLAEIGDGVAPGELRHLVIYHGDSSAGVPEGPFLSELSGEAGDLQLYVGRAGEGIQQLGDVADAVGGRADAWGGLLPLLGVATAAATALVALRLEGGVALSRQVAARPVGGVPMRLRGVARPIAACALLVIPSIALGVPTAAAQSDATTAGLGDLLNVFRGRDPCEDSARARQFNVSAVDLDIIFNRWGDHDPQGMMYVLDADIPALRAERARLQPVLEGSQSLFPNGTQDSLITPLVLRARAGECVEITLRNRLDPVPPAAPVDPLGPAAPHAEAPHATGVPAAAAGALPFDGPEPRRVSLHMHGLPIDPRNAGGDAVGENPDTTVGPRDVAVYRIRATHEGTFFFHDHADPTSAGTAAFPSLDSAFRGGTAHGLFGALVVEPPHANWTHPTTGQPVRSGWKADISVPGAQSFREFVILYHDPQLVARDGGGIREPATDHGLNYRVETLSHRIFDDLDRCPADAAALNRGVNPCEDISLVYASNVHGDPATPIPRAYVGDPTKFRLVHAGMEETHAHHLHGHRWRAVDGDASSTRIDSQTLSPSETFTQTLEAGAGGEGIAHAPGDYIYHCHLFPHLYGGMWSFFRVHDRQESDLKRLASNPTVPPPSPDYRGFPHFMQERQTSGYRPLRAPQAVGVDPSTGIDVKAVGAPYADVCPAGAPLRKYRVTAVEVPIRYNRHGDQDPGARIFVLSEDADAVIAGQTPPQPAVLRVRQGECMTITLLNRLPVSDVATVPIKGFGKTSIHTHLLEYDVLGSDGTSTGWIPDQTIWQGEEITNRFYADRDLETIVWHDHAAGLETAFKGIYGATLVEPPASDWLSPRDGSPIYSKGANGSDGVYDSGRNQSTGKYSELWRADVVGRGFKSFREFFASVQDFANLQNASGVPYRDQVDPHNFADFGLMGFNLRSEPLWHRLGDGKAITNSTKDVFSSRAHGDPATNLWEAYVGDRTIVRVHQVAYEEIHSFQLSGHRWNFGYRDSTSPKIDSQTIGISEAFNLYLDCGAGGCARSPGDYLYRGGGVDDVWAGAWGLFRVHERATSNLRALPDAGPIPQPGVTCPRGMLTRSFHVVAMEKELVYNGYGDHDMNGRMFVLAEEEPLVRQGLLVPKPLTLRVNEGDCVKIRLTNKLPSWSVPHAHADPQPTGGLLLDRDGPARTTGDLLRNAIPAPSNRVSLHAHVLTSDVRTSGGGAVGLNADTTVPPGSSRTYVFRADVPSPTAALLEDLGDVLYNRHHGLFGAIIVTPRGTYALDSSDGYPVRNAIDADIVGGFGGFAGWRDVALFSQNGLALTHANGLPIPLPGAHSADVTPAQAITLTQIALRDFLPGAAARASIEDVTPAPHGHYVHGTLEGVPFRAEVHRRDGVLDELTFAPEGYSPGSRVYVSEATGAPVGGLGVQLLLPDGNATSGMTGPSGEAHFEVALKRGSSTDVMVGSSTFPTWTDSERQLRLDVRAAPAQLPLAAAAGQAALGHLRNLSMPAGPVGLRAVDVTQESWRVLAGDAIRTYAVTLDPATRRVTSLSMESRATEFGPLTVVSRENATRIAKSFAAAHFGGSETLVHLAQSRTGHWQVDLGDTRFATTIEVDGVTGRILGAYHGSAASSPSALAANTSLVLQFRADDGGALDGTPIRIVVDGVLVATDTLRHGGRFVIPESLRGGVRDGARLRVELPSHGVSLPLALAPSGSLFAHVEGVGSTSPVDLQAAVDAARAYLARLAPPGGALLNASFGVAGINHEPGAWHVTLASGAAAVDVSVDDVTGEARGARVTSARTPIDDCSGEVPEHGGPHPTPRACRWSFSGHDEEDQGLHAFNYRTEPLEDRLNRVPDPASAFSTAVHGENGVEIFRAYAGDLLTIHLIGANDKGRVTAFSLSGHSWPREPQERRTELSQAQGGLAPGRVFLIRPHGGAGAGAGFDGDYLMQGAVQRQAAESGEWAILRVLPGLDPGLRRLTDALVLPIGAIVPVAPIPGEVPPIPVARMRLNLRAGAGGTMTATSEGGVSLPAGENVPVRIDVPGNASLPAGNVVILPSGVGDVKVTQAQGEPVDAQKGGWLLAAVNVPSRGATGGSGALRFDLVSGQPGAREGSSVETPFTIQGDPPARPTPTAGPTPTSVPTVAPSAKPSAAPTAASTPPPASAPIQPSARTSIPSRDAGLSPGTPSDPPAGTSPIPWGVEWAVAGAAIAAVLIARRRQFA